MQKVTETNQTTFVVSNKTLTERKLEYLALAGLGFCNKEIAELLFVSLSTVKKTLEEIYRKLNAIDRTNAVLIASMHHLLSNEVFYTIFKKYPNVQTKMIAKRQKRI